MSQYKTITVVYLFILLFNANSSFSQQYIFKDGDRVCFVGNSITMSGSFHHYIQLFYATRFPGRKVSFFNCGISGEQASNMLDRLDSDILVNKPTWCVVMVGSNDINETLYSEANKNLPNIEELKQQALDRYYQKTTLLIEKLLAAKTKVILEVPIIYDQTAKLKAEAFFGANDALEKCGIFLKQIGKKYGLLVVDYWSLTNTINKHVQAKDSTATIIGNDRSHPNKYGNFIMAYQFLGTQLKSSVVSRISIDKKNKKLNEISGCVVSNIVIEKDDISFTSEQSSLPFPVPDEIKMDSLVNFTKEFNTEIIRITGLRTGRYHLLIDSVSAGTFTNEQFKNGIEMSMNFQTPQFLQANSVLSLFNKYWKIAADLRAIKYVEYQHLRRLKNREDLGVVKSFFDSTLIKNKQSDNFGFFTRMFDQYLLLKPKEAELQSGLPVIWKDIYELNKPRTHHYRIERVADNTRKK